MPDDNNRADLKTESREVDTMSLVLVLDRLEQLAVQLVAVTNAAIFDVGAGDLSLLQWRTRTVLGSSEEPLRVNQARRPRQRVDAVCQVD